MASKNKAPVKKILVVDDDSDVLNLLEKWLVDEKYEVKPVGSAIEALNLLPVFKPGLVITDLFMEGMDGMSLLNKLHDDNPLLPVIMLSGQAQIPDAIKAMHLGVSAFLTKPVNKEEFLKTISKSLPDELDRSKLAEFPKTWFSRVRKWPILLRWQCWWLLPMCLCLSQVLPDPVRK